MTKINQNSNDDVVLDFQNPQNIVTNSKEETSSAKTDQNKNLNPWNATLLKRKSFSHHKMDEQMRLFLINHHHSQFKTNKILLKLNTAHKKQSSKKQVSAYRDLKISDFFAFASLGFGFGSINPNFAYKDACSKLSDFCNTLQGIALQRNKAHEIETQHEHEGLQFNERKLDEEAQRKLSQKDDLLRQIQQAEEKERSVKQTMLGR